jgi:hypothetical protein
MKKYGTSGSIIHGHHREAVRNAGKYPSYHQVNDPENIVFVSPLVHDFIHHQDFLDKNNQTFFKIHVDQADFMFSITDVFKTDFHKNPCQNNQYDLNQTQNHKNEQVNDTQMQQFFDLSSRSNS